MKTMQPTEAWGPANPIHRTGKYARQVDDKKSLDASDVTGVVNDGVIVAASEYYSEKLSAGNLNDAPCQVRRPEHVNNAANLTQSSDMTPPPRYQRSAAVENAGFEEIDERGDVIAVTSFRSDCFTTTAETSFRS
jgi:hypothetical protein